MQARTRVYKPKHATRVVTATSLFDGHDAAINIMRRILQASGVEVIHLGHNRSVNEIVDAAIEEDAQGIAVSSYQGGHLEFFKYMVDLLRERGVPHIRVFGGGGGVILTDEARELEAYGVERIYTPEDGVDLGLQGIINDLIRRIDFPTVEGGADLGLEQLSPTNKPLVAKLISAIELAKVKGDGHLAGLRSLIRGKNNSSARDHRHGRGGKIISDRRAHPQIFTRHQRYHYWCCKYRSLSSQDRRCTPGRSHQDEFHHHPPSLHALYGHPQIQNRAVRGRGGCRRSAQGRRLRSGDC